MPRKAGKGQSFTLTGIEEITEAFETLEPKLASRIIRQAIRKGLVPIRDEAKRLAREGPQATGFTAKNIKIRARPRRKHSIGLNIKVGDGDYKGKTFYAAFREYGTKRMAARPFMRPAFDTKKDEAAALVKFLIRQGIEGIARRP